MRISELHPRRFFLDTWRAIDAEAEKERQQRRNAGKSYDFRPLVALLFGTSMLILMEYVGTPVYFHKILRELELVKTLQSTGYWSLARHAWWAVTRMLGYFFIPLIVIKLYGERIRDQGLSTKGLREHAWIYILGYLVVLACVITVSFSAEFASYYPFYKLAHRSWFDFVCWELLYAGQFFALEFFFRGWWLRANKTMMGSQAIFVMVVPYVMIHFGKPMPETFGAILAGVFLGTLAMKTRSIWSGFFIHVSVAISMDIAALLQTTGLPTQWWPGS